MGILIALLVIMTLGCVLLFSVWVSTDDILRMTEKENKELQAFKDEVAFLIKEGYIPSIRRIYQRADSTNDTVFYWHSIDTKPLTQQQALERAQLLRKSRILQIPKETLQEDYVLGSWVSD